MLSARLDDGTVLCPRLSAAHTHWTRMKGLLGTSSLAAGEGLWIVPCNQVHMYLMRYAIDLVFLDENLRVVEVIDNQPISTISEKYKQAHSVIELPLGSVARSGVAKGQQVVIEGVAEPLRIGAFPVIGTWLGGLAMIVLFALFAYRHFGSATTAAQWAVALAIVAQAALLVLLFVTQRRSQVAADAPLDRANGVAATVLPLLLIPASALSSYWLLGLTLQVVGLGLVVLVFLTRPRAAGGGDTEAASFGLYNRIRNPMYLGCVLGYLGYLAAYPSWFNIVFVALILVAIIARAVGMERAVLRDPMHRAYLARVRWRFVPRVY